MHDVVLAVVSFAVTLTFILLLIRFAPRLGLLDHPDQRKQHDGAVPLVGGLALYCMLMAAYLSGVATSAHTISLLIATTVVTLVGAFDDHKHISPRVRLLMQFLAALIIVYGADLRLEHLGAIAPNGERVYLGPFATVVTLFGIMSVINAMNFIDGLDGLAGGVALIAIGGLGFIFAGTGKIAPDLIAVLIGGLVAFLLFNAHWFGRKKAAIFLGDAGSTLLGMLLAWLMVDNSQGSDQVISPVVALWLLAIPLIDFLSIIVRRAAIGHHPFSPDRKHIHHILNQITNSDTRTVVIIHVTAIAFAVIGCLGQLYDWSMNVMFYVFLVLTVVSFFAIKYALKVSELMRVFGVRDDA